MKLDIDHNIWGSVKELSGRDKGKVYAQRANYILSRALNDTAAYDRLFKNGRIRKGVLADEISCNRSALYDNPKIRALIDQLEGRTNTNDPSIGTEILPNGYEVAPLPKCVEILFDRLKRGHGIAGGQFSDRI